MTLLTGVSAGRLGAIVGEENVVTDAVKLAGYAVDGIVPGVAARPANSGEVAELVCYAAAENFAVIPTGARTKLAIGAPPRRFNLAIDLTRMIGIPRYDPGDLTLTVDAGIPLAHLARTLTAEGQWLPLSAPFWDQATIGGTIASGADAPERQAYGTPRDYILGVEFVTGEGTPARSGGRVVKNVAGYDLHKLHYGALGSLGILTRIHFRTFPLPRQVRGFVAAFPDAKSALRMRRLVSQSPLSPLTIEILSPSLVAMVAAVAPADARELSLPMPKFPATGWVFATSFAGPDAVLERYDRELRQIAADAKAISAETLEESDRISAWKRMREFLALLRNAAPGATILRLSVVPEEIATVFERARAAGDAAGLPTAGMARGLGVVYIAFLPPDREEGTLARLAQACTDLFHAGTSLGGRAVVRWCPPELKKLISVWSTPREDFALMQKIKHVFDPRGVLAPGRFVGGL